MEGRESLPEDLGVAKSLEEAGMNAGKGGVEVDLGGPERASSVSLPSNLTTTYYEYNTEAATQLKR